MTNSKILNNINSKENRKKVLENDGTNKKRIITLMIVIAYFLITIPPFLSYGEIEALIVALVMPVVGLLIMFNMLQKSDDILDKIVSFTLGLLFIIPSFIVLIFPTLIQDLMYFIGYMIGIVCIVGMSTCLKYLPKRTKYGNEMLGKISGFKNFLEVVEKEKLESLVMKNPNYFYDILPYTYVLGISDKWIKKFELVSLKEPTWYNSTNKFDIIWLSSFMDDTMTSVQKSMSYKPTNSSNGGSFTDSSGGGISGGGSGGGGGGSW